MKIDIRAVWRMQNEINALRKDKEILIKENIILNKQLLHFAFLRKHCSFYKHTFDKNVKITQIATYDDDHEYLFTKSYYEEYISNNRFFTLYDDDDRHIYTYEFKYIKKRYKHNEMYKKYADIYTARTYTKNSKLNWYDIKLNEWYHNKEKRNDDVMCIHLLNMLDCNGTGKGCEIYIRTPINEPMRLEIKIGHYEHYKFVNGISVDQYGSIKKNQPYGLGYECNNEEYINIRDDNVITKRWSGKMNIKKPIYGFINIGNDNVIVKDKTNCETIKIKDNNFIIKYLANGEKIKIKDNNFIIKRLANGDIINIVNNNVILKHFANHELIEINNDNSIVKHLTNDELIEINDDNVIIKELTNGEIINIRNDNVIMKNLTNGETIVIKDDNFIYKKITDGDCIKITDGDCNNS
jgi:hypothetical protein